MQHHIEPSGSLECRVDQTQRAVGGEHIDDAFGALDAVERRQEHRLIVGFTRFIPIPQRDVHIVEEHDAHMPEEVKQARVAGVMEVQQQIAFAYADQQIGKELAVVIDGPDPEFANHFRGRTYADSPDIDCEVRVKGKNLRSGDFIKVKVTAADGYDLAGRSIGSPW